MSPHELYAVERALLQRFYSNLPRSEARLSPRMIASGNSRKSVISIAVLWRSADGLRACVKCGFERMPSAPDKMPCQIYGQVVGVSNPTPKQERGGLQATQAPHFLKEPTKRAQ